MTRTDVSCACAPIPGRRAASHPLRQALTIDCRGSLHNRRLPDVRALRERLQMSQQEFAHAYRIPLPTLKGWEQGRRQPDATAAAFLSVIARLPKEILTALKF